MKTTLKITLLALVATTICITDRTMAMHQESHEETPQAPLRSCTECRLPHHAAQNKHLDCLKYWVGILGVDFLSYADKETALQWAVGTPDNNEPVIRYLLEKGANVMHKCPFATGSGETALHIAIRAHNLAHVKLLVESLTPEEAKNLVTANYDCRGRTPLMLAYNLMLVNHQMGVADSFGQREIAEYLHTFDPSFVPPIPEESHCLCQ